MIFPATTLARILDIKPKGVPWHDDPYHEYLLFGCLPGDDNAVVGRIPFERIPPEFNALLPGLYYTDPHEGLNASLDWMTRSGFLGGRATGVQIYDIYIARRAADELILPIDDKDMHFQIVMMFLSLRKRRWDQGDVQTLRDAFVGKCFFRFHPFRTFACLHFRSSNTLDVPVCVEGLNHSRQVGGRDRVGQRHGAHAL